MINPGNQDFIDSTGISADSTKSYTLKAVTSRGNIATFSVSPDTATQIQIILPKQISPEQQFTVVSIITNNSTLPNNIANLVPIITNNATLTQVDAISPASIAVLPQGNSVTFTSSWIAPDSPQGINFVANYTGAPLGAGVSADMSVALLAETEQATNSQWSQAASRVGILISGIPNPISTSTSSDEWGKWGIGIINPLDREVEVYAVGITTTLESVFAGATLSTETTNAGWLTRSLGDRESIIWESGPTPTTIAGKSVAQFVAEFELNDGGSVNESDVIISAITSEGKLNVRYPVLTKSGFPLINAFYTTDSGNAEENWTYVLEGLNSNTNYQFNATVQNAGAADLESDVSLLILVPAGFSNVTGVTSGGWGSPDIVPNPDGSHIIKVTSNPPIPDLGEGFKSGWIKTFKFTADTPTVTDDKLYVFQTTTVYTNFNGTGKNQLASALSEAGVEVVP
jgi:hypothetical protein